MIDEKRIAEIEAALTRVVDLLDKSLGDTDPIDEEIDEDEHPQIVAMQTAVKLQDDLKELLEDRRGLTGEVEKLEQQNEALASAGVTTNGWIRRENAALVKKVKRLEEWRDHLSIALIRVGQAVGAGYDPRMADASPSMIADGICERIIALKKEIERLERKWLDGQTAFDTLCALEAESTTRTEKAEADLAEVAKDRDKQHQQAQDAAHVLTRIPLAHEDLNVCGCAMCERVRAGMTDAGYLEPITDNRKAGE